MEDVQHERRLMVAQLPIPLLLRGQLWKSRPQVALRIAIKAVLTATPLPLAKERQGQTLTACESCVWPWRRFHGQRGFTEIVSYDIKRGQEGVDIDHRNCFYLGEDRAILQAGDTFRSPVK